MSSGQGTRFCFTINNPTEVDCNAVLALQDLSKYLIAGDEVGESGTPHIQGYVVFKKKYRLSKVSKLLPRAHLTQARGSSADNRNYCSKGGHFEEFGDCPEDSRLTSDRVRKKNLDDWQVAFELAKADRIDEIAPYMQIRYMRGLQLIRDNHRPVPVINPELTNVWIWGGSGSGKTKACWTAFPNHYDKMKNKWWCGYRGEKVVCIQELGRRHEKLSEHLKQWADHYPFRCEYKGGSFMVNFQAVIVTSNYHPEVIWTEEEVLDPLHRRFNILKFPDNFEDGIWDSEVLRINNAIANH